MQINLNPTSERGASRDAVNRPRETLGDSHLISSDPRSRFGLVCDLLCCRGNNFWSGWPQEIMETGTVGVRLLGHFHRSRRALERRDHARKGVGSNGGTP